MKKNCVIDSEASRCPFIEVGLLFSLCEVRLGSRPCPPKSQWLATFPSWFIWCPGWIIRETYPLSDSVTQPDRGPAIVGLPHQAHMAFSVCRTKTGWRTVLSLLLPQAAGNIFHWPEGSHGLLQEQGGLGNMGEQMGHLVLLSLPQPQCFIHILRKDRIDAITPL